MDFERIAKAAREESDKARGVIPQTGDLASAVGKLTSYTFVLAEVADLAHELLAELVCLREWFAKQSEFQIETGCTPTPSDLTEKARQIGTVIAKAEAK